MSKKEKIIDLFYIKHLKPVDIALKLDVSNSYVTKVIKKDSRYHKEKTQRKQQNKVKHKEQTIEYIKAKQKSNKDSYEALKYQLKKDAEELSYYILTFQIVVLENLMLVLINITIKRKDLK